MTVNLSVVSKNTKGLEFARDLVAGNIHEINHILAKEHQSSVPLINQVVDYIIENGGKRLRPLIMVLIANAFGYKEKSINTLAAAIEFLHTATLLHDDVVDESQLRRGNKTANAVWSNQASVLVGDFLYSRAFQMILALDHTPVYEILHSLANATNLITEGEVMQLAHRHNPDITEEEYLKILEYKTGKLFAVSAHIGSIVAGASMSLQQAASQFGIYLGIAFQLIDDVLDYEADTNKTGKNIGDDLAEGSPTLPLIYAMQQAKAADQNIIREAIETGNVKNIAQLQQIIDYTNAIAYTKECAEKQIKLALSALHSLPPSKYREGLAELAQFAIHRDH